jgi:hypothetical protein
LFSSRVILLKIIWISKKPEVLIDLVLNKHNIRDIFYCIKVDRSYILRALSNFFENNYKWLFNYLSFVFSNKLFFKHIFIIGSINQLKVFFIVSCKKRCKLLINSIHAGFSLELSYFLQLIKVVYKLCFWMSSTKLKFITYFSIFLRIPQKGLPLIILKFITHFITFTFYSISID